MNFNSFAITISIVPSSRSSILALKKIEKKNMTTSSPFLKAVLHLLEFSLEVFFRCLNKIDMELKSVPKICSVGLIFRPYGNPEYFVVL